MSTPTRISQELKNKSDRSLRRMKTFKRSLLMLGGLTKLQRRSITALIQDFWLENAKANLDTSTTHMKHEAIGTHNDEFTDSSPLTSTDTDSDSNTEQRSQSTSTHSTNLSLDNFSSYTYSSKGISTKRAKTEYFDIQTESSEADTSKSLKVDKEMRPTLNKFKPLNPRGHNRFECLEELDNESESDNDMSISEEIAEKEEKISQLEQQIIAIEIDNHSEIERLKDELMRSKSLQNLHQTKYREKELKVNMLEDQVKALLKEQSRCKQNTDIIDHVIRKHYDDVLKDLIIKTHKDEASMNKSMFARLLDDKTPNLTRDAFDKTRISLLKRKDFIEMISEVYISDGLVPVTEIEKMEKEGSNFKLHLEMVLAKLTRAYAKKIGN